MTVAELRELLDSYAGHLTVLVVVDDGDDETVANVESVGFSNVVVDDDGNSAVLLESQPR